MSASSAVGIAIAALLALPSIYLASVHSVSVSAPRLRCAGCASIGIIAIPPSSVEPLAQRSLVLEAEVDVAGQDLEPLHLRLGGFSTSMWRASNMSSSNFTVVTMFCTSTSSMIPSTS